MNTNPRTGELLEYLDLERMRSCLQEHKDRVAAVIIECIHGYSRWDLISSCDASLISVLILGLEMRMKRFATLEGFMSSANL
jgi:hypothetical protein